MAPNITSLLIPNTDPPAQQSQNVSLQGFVAALTTSFVLFGIQILIFELMRNKVTRIYIPKTYLVPERERTRPPSRFPLGWVGSIFQYRDREIIKKCGLDAYFFLRYLQTMLIIFVPLLVIFFPILLPLNCAGGRGKNEVGLAMAHGMNPQPRYNVSGLDTLAWGNVRPENSDRYWAHLVLAVVAIVWVCGIFFSELKVYVRIRQDYLTSAEHRLRASATTMLVCSIPRKWLSVEALEGLYDVFPGGIRKIWINRDYDRLLANVNIRAGVAKQLEEAETQLICACKRVQAKRMAADAKRDRRKNGTKSLSKEESMQRSIQVDTEAEIAAQGEGLSSSDAEICGRVTQDSDEKMQRSGDDRSNSQRSFKSLDGGAIAGGKDPGNLVLTTDGLMHLDASPTAQAAVTTNRNPNCPSTTSEVVANESMLSSIDPEEDASARRPPSNSSPTIVLSQSPALTSPDCSQFHRGRTDSDASLRTAVNPRPTNNAVQWKFWRVPEGGYASPTPRGYREGGLSLDDGDEPESNGNKLDGNFTPVPNMISQNPSSSQVRPAACETAQDEDESNYFKHQYNSEYNVEITGNALWREYVREKDRPHHRVSKYPWLPSILGKLPLLSYKVDTIVWCRGMLIRLNESIRYDQDHQEQFPLMNSAFIQFNHQVAAHMASQAVSHHVPRQMVPRTVEVSPQEIIWGNMSLSWWGRWIRTGLVQIVVAAMVVLWAVPVTAVALLPSLPNLLRKFHWLKRFDRPAVVKVLSALSGILPAVVVSTLLFFVPMILYKFAEVQGAQTQKARHLSVQGYYFFFTFVQVFLVVSIAGGTFAQFAEDPSQILSLPQKLAQNLPKSANYFFAYMILQACSVSTGNLCQWYNLINSLIAPRMSGMTARQKWRRNAARVGVNWGAYYPFYTTIACVGLIYSIIAPLILLFAVITFTLWSLVNRYNMLYVVKPRDDTGGLMYPRALNHTFIGLYVMELCLIGMFGLVRDEKENASCIPQAIIMGVSLVLTALFQILLNKSFSPLYNHLPITFEDEAVLRDEVFERTQAARRLLDSDEQGDGDDEETRNAKSNTAIELMSVSRSDIPRAERYRRFDPRRGATAGMSWASRGARMIHGKTCAVASRSSEVRLRQRHRRGKDLEAQKGIGQGLFDYEDVIEDYAPEEREALVDRAFQHQALRARHPIIWIPRDDLGVSENEIKRTIEYGEQYKKKKGDENTLRISHAGTALDHKFRVVYGRNPPDFDPRDCIRL
ncbi:MAG: hypothetical protein M1818_000469 [Claussenomyces sp. TS43310]|nr:MAG: hypothetical protein M1818_000469 [Claussenomyces sp. TS43310]